MENILVTGGTGFVGRHVVIRLVEKGHRIFALVRNKEKLAKVFGRKVLKGSNVTPLVLGNPAELTPSKYKKMMEQNKITTVVHTAAIVGERWRIPWAKYYKVNVAWTENLAQGFINAHVDHNKFLFTSTVGVYGTIPQCLPANEETPYNPNGKYHKSKMLAEKKLLGLKFSRDLPLVIFRPTIMYGNWDYGFLYKVFRLVKKGVFPLSNKNFKIHLLDVEKLAEIYTCLINENMPRCYIFNVADQKPIEANILIESIENWVGNTCLTVPSFVFSILRKMLAFNDQYSIQIESISRDWFYCIKNLRKYLKIPLEDTISNLEKYLNWYTKEQKFPD